MRGRELIEGRLIDLRDIYRLDHWFAVSGDALKCIKRLSELER